MKLNDDLNRSGFSRVSGEPGANHMDLLKERDLEAGAQQANLSTAEEKDESALMPPTFA